MGFYITDEQLRTTSEFGAHLGVELEFDNESQDE
jgi:hypothetical protein